jgi:ATP-dependent RNA helicase RhlE
LSTFESLGLAPSILRAVSDVGYETPTPIQEQAIPHVVNGRDLLGCAQTGTGKTAAFTLPVIHNLSEEPTRRKRRPIRVLVLTPTRELASQIQASFDSYGRHRPFRSMVIFGGVSQNPQVKSLKQGVDIVVATPGRLIDLMGQGHVDLSEVEVFALDEADRMLDMGFINDMRKIMRELPNKRQNLLFSATMPKSIAKLAKEILHNPIRVDIEPESPAVDRIDQRVMFVKKSNKRKLLSHFIDDNNVQKAIVFSRTKHGAKRIVKHLKRDNISAAEIHGNKSQNARERALKGFRKGKVRVLVATNIAARGIDVDEITHVFNFDLPNHSETYVHRIGRTARAGSEGIAISFCDESEGKYLRSIEKLIGHDVDVIEDHHWHFASAIPPKRNHNGGGGGRNKKGRKRRGRRR